MKTLGFVSAVAVLGLLQACTTTDQRQVECIGATTIGALAGAAVGSQFGGGTGQDILTAGGAVAGGTAAGQLSGC